jgi:hypothetical protein
MTETRNQYNLHGNHIKWLFSLLKLRSLGESAKIRFVAIFLFLMVILKGNVFLRKGPIGFFGGPKSQLAFQPAHPILPLLRHRSDFLSLYTACPFNGHREPGGERGCCLFIFFLRHSLRLGTKLPSLSSLWLLTLSPTLQWQTLP